LADFKLPARVRAVLVPLARIVCPPDLEELGLTDAVVDHMELMMRAIPTYLRAGLVAGALSFETGAIARYGKPFSRLTPEKQEAWFATWWRSPVLAFRQLAKGLKGLLAMGYWEQPQILARMEYHPERWIAEVAARRLNRYAQEIERQDAMVVAPDPLIPSAALSRKVDHDAA
jgi:hypothetical protein